MTISRLFRAAPLALALAFALALPCPAAPLEVAAVKHEGEVDFEKEILPIFRRNCLACHSATEAQSDLVLESPQTILKGGSLGPAVVAGKSAESVLLKLSTHQEEPFMPPPDNDVKAKNLTPQELGLLKLWIDQGAKGEVKSSSGPIAWQPLPAGVNPIFTVAISEDGQYAAAGRANQIFLYHVPSKRELGRLTDPALLQRGTYTQPGVADLDLIQSLKFSPDGNYLASGGYRTLKLWRKPQPGKKLDLAALESPARSIATSADRKWAAIGEENGKIKVYDVSNGKIAKTLVGHSGPVTGVAFTADGAKLVSGSQDKTFRVWNLADSQQIASIETPAPVNAVAIVSEGKEVATGGADNNIRLWALPAAAPAEAPKPVKELPGHGGPVNALVSLTPSGSQLLSGSQDGTVRVWDIATAKAVKTMTHGAPVAAVAVRPDEKRFASVSSANNIKLWNADDQKQIAEMKGDFRTLLQVGAVTREVALAKRNVDSAKADLAAAEKRKTAEEENAKKSAEAVKTAETELAKKTEATKKPTADKEAADKALADATAAKTKADEAKKVAEDAVTKTTAALTAATKPRDEATAAAAAAATASKQAAEAVAKAKEAAEKDAANPGLKDAFATAEKAAAEADTKNKAAADAKVAADKAFAEAETAKKTAEATRQQLDKAATDAQTALTQAEAKVKQLAPAYQKAVDEKAAADRTLQAAKRSVERANEAVKKAGEAVPVAQTLVKACEAEVAKRDEGLKAAQKTVTDSEKPIKAVAFSPNGTLLATVGDDQLLHTWDSETGAAVEVYPGQNAPLNVVAFTAEGNAITAAQNNSGIIWDFATEWKLERTIGSPDSAEQLSDRVTALDFSPDGALIASGGGEPSRNGEVKIWKVADGSLVRALKDPHSDTVFGLDFSPDGKQLASCGADRFVKVFDVADGKFVRSFEGHTHHVLAVSWRADGRLLASSGADNVIKVWDTRTGDQARTIQGFTKEVTSVSFVGDTDVLVASSGDLKVRNVNAANGGTVRDFTGTTDYMYGAAASADGKTIIAGGQDSILRVWDEKGQAIIQFGPPTPPAQATAAK